MSRVFEYAYTIQYTKAKTDKIIGKTLADGYRYSVWIRHIKKKHYFRKHPSYYTLNTERKEILKKKTVPNSQDKGNLKNSDEGITLPGLIPLLQE